MPWMRETRSCEHSSRASLRRNRGLGPSLRAQKTNARTSMPSRGAALGGLLGSSNEVCAVKRARPSSIESWHFSRIARYVASSGSSANDASRCRGSLRFLLHARDRRDQLARYPRRLGCGRRIGARGELSIGPRIARQTLISAKQFAKRRSAFSGKWSRTRRGADLKL